MVRTASIALGTMMTEQVEMEREAPTVTAPVVVPQPRVVEAPVATIATPPPRVVSPVTPAIARGGNTLRTLAWASGGVAVTFAGIGVVATVLGQSAADRWNDTRQCGASTGHGADACSDDLRTAQTMEALRWTGIVGAGALGVTSAVLFVISTRDASPARSAFVCGAGPGTVGVACGGSF